MSSQGDEAWARPGRATWPLLSGMIPSLADAYIPRRETGPGLAAGPAAGQTGLLVPADDAAGTSLGGLGGTGKTQLATAIARVLWEQQALDLLLWVNPSGRDAVLTSYAQALYDVGEPLPGPGPEAAAAQFLAWLAKTGRRWLVVFDDLADPAVLDGLWPSGAGGRVLVTTRQPGAAVRAPHPRVMPVGTFSPRESLSYLSTKLQAAPDQWIGAVDLAGDLGYLPIALAQASALMAETGLDCREYRGRFADRLSRLAGGQADPHRSIFAATWSLSVDLAEQLPSGDLARPALALLSLLDPNGVPGAVLTSRAACAYFSRFRDGPAVDQTQARAAVYSLARAGLASVDAASAARTIRIHALVQATVRQNLTAAEADDAGRAAAEALLQTWPRPGVPASFEQAMRDSTARLHEATGRVLWTPDSHPLLMRAGRSLETGQLIRPAISYWRSMLDISGQVLGPGHTRTLQIRDRLAAAHEAAGRPGDAAAAYERPPTERRPTEHAPTERRPTEHAPTEHAPTERPPTERPPTEGERVLGPGHAGTLSTRAGLAHADQSTDHADDAIGLPGHPRNTIAWYERALADWERSRGPDHPGTITARGNLAHAYHTAGRQAEALSILERTLADCERALGPDHPLTQTARENLAAATQA